MRFTPPPTYAVYERNAELRIFPHSVVGGSFRTQEEAEAWRKRYGYTGDNYYIAEEKPIFTEHRT